MSRCLPKMLYADHKGNIFDLPELCMAGMNGTLPTLPPVAWDARKKPSSLLIPCVKENEVRGYWRSPPSWLPAICAPFCLRAITQGRVNFCRSGHIPLSDGMRIGTVSWSIRRLNQ